MDGWMDGWISIVSVSYLTYLVTYLFPSRFTL